MSESKRVRTFHPSFDDPNSWKRFDSSKEAWAWEAAVRFYEKSLLTAAVRFYALANDRSKVIILLSNAGWGNTNHLEETLEARWADIEARTTKR